MTPFDVAFLIVVFILHIIWFLLFWYTSLFPAKKGLPVLMYHQVLPGQTDGLTVSTDQFDLQLMYLKGKGYQTISFKTLKALVKDGGPLPPKTVILTFDDAYLNFREYALPLLKKHNFTATVFVPVAFIGKTNIWDQGSVPIMTDSDLKRIALNEDIEIGLHSFLHRSYGDLALADMEDDLKNCRQTLDFYGIPFTNVLAYPYGGYPKKDPVLKEQMISLFKQSGLEFALRIGNDINPWPIRQPFEIKRIDIKGTDKFYSFRTKLRRGRAKLFS
jgi:peptidoglycan/xylan/chitin deacetylase (PgdA/CDA1 family)